ncbi:MAG: hypothetical protein F9K40_11805 [Kofleriaceae bacterium]|nr:MAG: hypothetical protein F9K40_11805 [Kofleriaceae bacterium]MBZ0235465.1 hypothetical protein [Kofleriaceae bacterium]
MPGRRPRPVSIVVAVAVAHLAACSTGAYPPRERPSHGVWQDRSYAARCNPSRAAPTADTLGAIAGGSLALAGLVFVANNQGGDDTTGAIAVGVGLLLAVPGGLVAAAYGSSARGGFRKARACREERARPLLDPLVVDLTTSARLLALRGDCVSARKLALEVRRYEARYFALETSRDPAIARCLDEPAAVDQSTTGPGQP